MMDTKCSQAYECKIFIGSKNEYLKQYFDRSILLEYIQGFQDNYHKLIPVRVTGTEFVCGSKYQESGWEIAVINYPKLDLCIEEIEYFCEQLTEYLTDRLRQKRVTLMTPGISTMYYTPLCFPQSASSKAASP